MFSKVLVPLDGSRRAERVLAYAARLNTLFQTKVFLFRCAEEVIVAGDEYAVPIPRVRSRELARVRSYLETLKMKWQKRIPKARILTSYGTPYEEILSCAKGEKVNLILMGTHGRTGLERWIMGSVSEKVLRSTRTAMLVVHTGNKAKISAKKLSAWPHHVLVPLDGSKTAERVFTPLKNFLSAVNCDLSFLRSVADNENASLAQAYIENIARRFSKNAASVRDVFLRQGNPAEAILRLANRGSVDLIAMTTHGRSGVNRFFFGSVTENVLRHTRKPLLLIRAK